jgi:hypothetical protein
MSSNASVWSAAHTRSSVPGPFATAGAETDDERAPLQGSFDGPGPQLQSTMQQEVQAQVGVCSLVGRDKV